jgi:hypothetical protein
MAVKRQRSNQLETKKQPRQEEKKERGKININNNMDKHKISIIKPDNTQQKQTLRRNTRTNKRQGGYATLRNQTRMSSNFCHHDWTM